MSSNNTPSKNTHKMCKSPSKNLQNTPKTTIKNDLSNYEVLNTNCTLVGSNNLNLDSKLNQNMGYQTPKINIYSKPMKTASTASSASQVENQIKKPQTPRTSLQLDQFVHSQNINKFNFNQQQLRTQQQQQQQQQQQTAATNFVNQPQKMLNFEGIQQNSVHTVQSLLHNVPISSSSNFIPQQQTRNIITSTKASGTNFTSINNSILNSNTPNLSNLNNGVGICAMSPSSYSNPSPNYPSNAVSPYNVQISSPANSISSIASGAAGIKSPVASPQHIRPPTPQPILPQAFQQIPVMTSGPNLVQIIHANPNSASTYQNHSVITRQTIIAPPAQNLQQQSPLIKIKPPQNILPKPPSSGASPQLTTKSGRNSSNISQNSATTQQIQPAASPAQIVLPNQAILPTAQAGTLLLNQMPLIVQQNTAHGVQLILRPNTPNSASQLAAAGKLGAQQNLILQQNPTTAQAAPQVILQHAATQRSTTIQQPQQLVRVLTANGMIQPLAPTYIAMNNQSLNLQQLTQSTQQIQQASNQPNKQQTQIISAPGGPQLISTGASGTVNMQPHQGLIGACLPGPTQQQTGNNITEQLPPPKRKPKKKKKNKDTKLDLGSIMKLSGIGDDDDVMFESDTSESTTNTEQKPVQKSESPIISSPSTSENDFNIPKRIGNIQITGVTQDNNSKLSQNLSTTNTTNSLLSDKPITTFGQSQISVQQSLSDINAINQNLAQIGLISQNSTQNFINSNSQILSQITTSTPSVQNVQNLSLNPIPHDNQNLANFLQALNNQGQNFSVINSQNIPGISGVTSQAGLTTFPTNSQTQSALSSIQNQKFLPTVQSSNQNFPNILNSLVTSTSLSQSLNTDNLVSKPQVSQNFSTNVQKTQQTPTNIVQNLPGVQNLNAHFNIPNAISNIQVQNYCASNNSNLILNQGATNAIIAPNISNFSGNITINNGIIPNTNLTIPNTNLALPNFLQTNTIVQPTADVNNFGNNTMQQRTGGFKLALSEDGRLILQHDPNLNQDIQSQLLLQSIFGINLQGGNLVLTSVSNQTSSHQPKPLTVTEPVKKPIETTTKTTNIIQNAIPSVKTTENQSILQETQSINQVHSIPNNSQNSIPPPPPPVNNQNVPTNTQSNVPYIVNLTPEQLETLKRNGQVNVNGQTIYMQRPNLKEHDKNLNKSPKNNKTKRKTNQFDTKSVVSKSLQEQLTSNVVKTTNLEHFNNLQQQQQQQQQQPKIPSNFSTTSLAQPPVNKVQSNSSQIVFSTNTTSQISSNTISSQSVLQATQSSLGAQSAPNSQAMPIPAVNETTEQPQQNIICIQHSNSSTKTFTTNTVTTNNKLVENTNQQMITQQLLANQKTMLKQNQSEQLIILQQSNNDNKVLLQQNTDKKILISSNNQEIVKTEHQDMIFSNQTVENKQVQFLNGAESNHINVEQFLSNLNINSTNLGQLISQKLSQELPNVDHKIVNIQPGPNAGQLVAKIDILSENMHQILNNTSELNNQQSNNENIMLPQLIQMNVKQENEVFSGHAPPEINQNQQLPALIIGSNVVAPQNEPQTSSNSGSNSEQTPVKPNTVYQRIQTIQLTPQKQQLLKSVQLQIQALTARLQQKSQDASKNESKTESNIPENDIHTALRHLYMEQQRILATGKVLPTVNQNITNLNCNMETVATQSVSVTTTSKSNGTFLTSLLQQPVVSVNQNQKVYYHNGNQIIAISPTNWQQSQSVPPSPVVTPSVSNNPPTTTTTTTNNTTATSQNITTTINNINPAIKVKKLVTNTSIATSVSTTSAPTTFLTPNKITPVSTTSEKGCQMSPNHNQVTVKTEINNVPNVAALLSPGKRIVKPTYSKAQLIEQQLQTDQNGANNPDITTPFANKADACKRLVRYHCYNQPILSQKDLDKADEIFELTARHFIGKFQGMINKYKYLLLKESMREVQTSELMMIDRMFLAEEQQSFLKLQSDVKLQNELENQENVETNLGEIYNGNKPSSKDLSQQDIKPIPLDTDDFIKDFVAEKRNSINHQIQTDQFTVKQENCEPDKSDQSEIRYDDATNTDFNIKCGLNYFSDESSDSTNYRVYEDSPKQFDEFLNKDCFGQDNKNRDKPDKNSNKNSGMESYNTTKIIGNFEIEINNKGCNSQESYTKNFRQKIIDNKIENRSKSDDNFGQKSDEYDEWLCIQRELGYIPEINKLEHDSKSDQSEVTARLSSNSNAPDIKPNKSEDLFKKSSKRSSNDSNSSRLETLKKFRVEKHNSKSKKSGGSIIGEVKFEVRIEHKKVFAEQNREQTSKKNDSTAHPTSQNSIKRSHYDYSNKNLENNEVYNSKRPCVAPISSQFNRNSASFSDLVSCNSTSPVVNNYATAHQSNSVQIKQEETYLDDSLNEIHDSSHEDQFDTSIDEQVQSAIDSILNLQQIASMTEKTDGHTMHDASGSTSTSRDKNVSSNTQAVTCRNINTLTCYPQSKFDSNSELVNFNNRNLNDSFSDASDTLDEAVKSILS